MGTLNEIMDLLTSKRWSSNQYPEKFRNTGRAALNTHEVYYATQQAMKRAAKDQPAVRAHQRADVPVQPKTVSPAHIHPQRKGEREMSNKPVDTIKMGRVRASIFENTRREDGEKFYSVTMSRPYKDEKTDTWKHTNRFSRDDLRDIVRAANIAADEISLREGPAREAPQTRQHQSHDDVMRRAAPEQPAATPEAPSQDINRTPDI